MGVPENLLIFPPYRSVRGGATAPAPRVALTALDDREPYGSGLAGGIVERNARVQFKHHVARNYGTNPTIRSGPPLPPSIFIGSARTKLPVGGNSPRFATFSKPGMFSW